ncbi:flagellar hook-associated protein FlgK [Roseospira visakhapatnamensis]|uniref:Flagellar hook-associated protein 1 n=1 Tax=Roseospira visakhapatnamensis TaxID=390880 RepID=A0A7W6R9X1_9PROT|nr:flagellar hook-associated protein FlgK [Roseospira visakhapatnamensis]MBB4264432.1 flagellar hook-associated protein 1 FlgK [Roseospira visakhapatnamensis]
MSLNLALGAALSGLQTNQKALDLVSRNIANVNTVGYTKKIFNQETRILTGRGVGVQVSEITRRVDYGLIEELNQENATLEALNAKADYFQRMQDMFGKPADNSSIAHMLSELAEQVEVLALEPNQTEQHMTTVQRAEDVSQKLNSMGDLLQRLRLDADKDLERAVDRVNTLLTDIQGLNEEIAYALATGGDGVDLMDQRERAVKELTAYMDITSYTRDGGELVVYTKGGTILVDREAKQLSHDALSSFRAWESRGGNDIQPISIDGLDITDDFGEGQMAALLDLRDTILPGYQAQLDELSEKLRDTVNLVHNRGTSFPNLATEYQGTRTFLDTANQQVALDANHDVVVAIFDADGKQVEQSTFKTAGIMGVGLTDLDAVAANLQGWITGAAGGVLAGATVSYTSDGKMNISLNDNSYSLVFRDENSSAASPTQEDALISFDSDGDGTVDSTHSGLSAFFGLNDVYTASRQDWMWDSGVKAEGWRPFSGTDTLNFSDSTTLVRGSLTLNGTETIADIAQAINDDATLSTFLEAEVVQENGGVRLRIKHLDGDDMVITQNGANTDLIDALGLQVGNAGLANDLAIKDEIKANPSLISRGAMLYNADTGEYTVSTSDNTTANALAAALADAVTFDTAGGVPGTTRSLTEYATLTLSRNSTEAATNERRKEYQTGLVDTLSLKHAEISAVNLDEEMAQLIVYQQSYAASAKVISTTADLFDILNSIV